MDINKILTKTPYSKEQKEFILNKLKNKHSYDFQLERIDDCWEGYFEKYPNDARNSKINKEKSFDCLYTTLNFIYDNTHNSNYQAIIHKIIHHLIKSLTHNEIWV